MGVYKSASTPAQIASIFVGANDFLLGFTTTQCYSNLLSWVALAKADGFNVLVITPISHIGTINGVTGDDYVADLAGKIIAGAAANGYTVVNAHGNANLGGVGAYANTTYFSDGIHPTQAGQDILASLFEAAI